MFEFPRAVECTPLTTSDASESYGGEVITSSHYCGNAGWQECRWVVNINHVWLRRSCIKYSKSLNSFICAQLLRNALVYKVKNLGLGVKLVNLAVICGGECQSRNHYVGRCWVFCLLFARVIWKKNIDTLEFQHIPHLLTFSTAHKSKKNMAEK